ncbi:MAG: pyridoxal phosphate-dependent aminotransferase [Ignavibacterium sp.]
MFIEKSSDNYEMKESKLSSLISSIEESRTLSVTALINRLKAEGKNVLSFSAGEPDFNTPDYIKQVAIKAINDNFTRYTANEGDSKLISAIINKLKRDNNLDFKPENILVSNGAKHSLYNILMSICNKGDEVIFQAPYWTSYPEMVKLTGASYVIVDASVEQNYKITPQQLKKAINGKTKAFIFNTPSNPSGSVYSKEEILELAEVLKDKDIFIISDEIYEKIIFDNEKHFSIGSISYLKDRAITVNGLSKSYAMTGWRIGYAAGSKEVIKLARNLQSHSTSNATSISQAAAIAALSEESVEIQEMVNQFKQRRDFIVKELNKIKGIKCPLPKGAFYVFFDVSDFYGKSYKEKIINDSSSYCNYLLEEVQVGLVPGIAFGNDHCVRMSYACSMNIIKEGVERIKLATEKL